MQIVPRPSPKATRLATLVTAPAAPSWGENSPVFAGAPPLAVAGGYTHAKAAARDRTHGNPDGPAWGVLDAGKGALAIAPLVTTPTITGRVLPQEDFQIDGYESMAAKLLRRGDAGADSPLLAAVGVNTIAELRSPGSIVSFERWTD